MNFTGNSLSSVQCFSSVLSRLSITVVVLLVILGFACVFSGNPLLNSGKVASLGRANQPSALLDPFDSKLALRLTNEDTKRDSRHLPRSDFTFEANVGQTRDDVKFLSHGLGYNLYLTNNSAVLALRHDSTRDVHQSANSNGHANEVIRMEFAGARSGASISAVERMAGVTNYFIGNDPTQWRTDVPNYRAVRYDGIYPGIDLEFYANQNALEYDVAFAPGVDPGIVRLKIDGTRKIQVEANGDLLLLTKGGQVVQHKPIAYQEKYGTHVSVEARYVVRSDNEVAFLVGEYDRAVPLIIDPTLSYSTYLGGSSNDLANDVAVDGSGNVYVTGRTDSLNYPTSVGSFQPSFGGIGDAFVTKLSASGSLIYSTYIGGNGFDFANAIAVDSDGSAYITGDAKSTNFPVTAGAFQTVSHGGTNGEDAFVTKLSPSGNALIYSTYLGGTADDQGTAIAVDSAGHAFITGQTGNAVSNSFPVLNGFQTTQTGSAFDAFVTELNSSGSALQYSTFLGGNKFDEGNDIALDTTGKVYVTGMTQSTNFPILNAYQPTLNSAFLDAFVTKIDPGQTGASSLIFSTFLGGGLHDQGEGIAVDANGSAYVTGLTQSTDFPTTAGAFRTTFAGGIDDAFVTKLAPGGNALVYSTYLGGSAVDEAYDIALDSTGNAYIVGTTNSTNFPVVSAIKSTLSGSDAFLTKLDASGASLVHSTYLGGGSSEIANGIAIDSAQNIYVTGNTQSADFPLVNPVQSVLGGLSDAFVAKITETVCPASLSISGSVPDFCEGQTQAVNLALNGTNLSGATVNWSLTGSTSISSLGSGTILSATLSGLTPGSYSLVATASASGCTDLAASTNFTVHGRPFANAGPDQVFCENASTTLAGNTPTVGTGTWSLVGGSGTIVDPHNPNTQVTNLAYGGNFFRWTVDDGTCQNGDDIVGIDRQQTPTTPDAGPDQVLCETSTATLNGNTPTVGFAIWELVSGSATITNPFAATTTVTNLGYGPNLFQRKIDNGSCGALIDQMTITRSHAPTIANAGPDKTFCGSSTTTLAGDAPASGTGTWTLVSGAGTIADPSNPATTVTNLGEGANVFRWTISGENCPSSFDDVTITTSASGCMNPIQKAKLIAPDGAPNDIFGRSVAISGDTVVVGSFQDDDAGTDSGSAYVYVRSGGVWSLQQKLTANDAAAGDQFGWSVAISGDTIVVGAAQHAVGNVVRSGAAYVFVRSGNTWTQQQQLVAGDAGPDNHEQFGRSVAISGDTVAVGASADVIGSVETGSAYVFTRSGSSWTQQQKLIAGDILLHAYFGDAIAISGDSIVVGAHAEDTNVNRPGAAYVFVRSGAIWTQQQKLMASDGIVQDWFGFSVSIDGDTIAVGAPHYSDWSFTGEAYVFRRSGAVWNEEQRLIMSDAAQGDLAGMSVAISGDNLVVGAPGDDVGFNFSGSLRFFTHSGGTWVEQPRVIPTDMFPLWFGDAAAIDGRQIVVGSPYDPTLGPDQGSAYVFAIPGIGCSPDTTLPSVTAPAPTSAAADANCQAAVPNVLSGSSASDNCPGVSLSQSPTAGTLVEVGPHTITVTATDGDGNTSTAMTTFTVTDNTPPSISCPANISVFSNLNATSAVVNYVIPTATDNCGVPVVSCSTPSGAAFPLGATMVNCTATDAADNSASCSFTVAVAQPPSPTTFVVDSTGDGGDSNTADGFCNDGTGHCTLRAAIQQANATSNGVDTIAFNIPGAGVHTITPATSFNNINQPVIIDGYTQPGASANTLASGDNAVPLIEINGASVAARGFQLNASGNTIRGLVINRFGGNGIQTAGSSAGNIIEGNFIGTDATGLNALPNAGNGVAINGSSNNTVGGPAPQARNVISGNTNNGVTVAAAVASNVVTAQSSNNLIQGNLIGTNKLGTAALGNRIGIFILGSSNNLVGGTSTTLRNIVSGNRNQGVAIQPTFHSVNGSMISPASDNAIQGNLIGTDVTGTLAMGNGTSGAFAGVGVLGGFRTLIGGTAPGAGNVISNNTGVGINLQTANVSAASAMVTAQQNIVQGNYVGTDITGSAAMPNSSGISIFGGDHNLIGGTMAAARNIASGNTQVGIWLGNNVFTNGAGVSIMTVTENNTVQGNYVGTNASGTTALPNNIDGIRLDSGAIDNLIGGPAPGAGNLSSGNVGHGIHIDDVPFVGANRGTARNTIRGNFIGTDYTGTQPLGNHAPGVIVFEGASDNIIGGTEPGAGNTIAFNLPGVFPDGQGGFNTVAGAGISIAGSVASTKPTLNNHVSGNSIFGNDGLGIDINLSGNAVDVQDGVTPNDACDTDDGANNLQNAPVLTSACANGNTTTVQGILNSAADTTFTIEFFANAQCDGSGSGEGQTYLGSIQVATDQNCIANFTFIGTVPIGQPFITATATDPNGNTSEFSSCGPNHSVPVITLNGTNPLTVECHTSFTDPGATATEICAGSIPVTSTSNVDPNTPGSYTITYSAGNGSQTASKLRTVNVVDTTRPTISCPANQFAITGLGGASLRVNYPGPTAADTCGMAQAACSPASGSLFQVGATTVTCTATDSSGNAAACTFTVSVLTPQVATQQLSASVNNLVSQGRLNDGQGKSLNIKLQQTINSLNQEDIKSACGELDAFVNQVTGLMRAGRLTAAEAQPLIDSANAILHLIGCGN